MSSFTDYLEDLHVPYKKPFLIIGAGGSVREFSGQLHKFIDTVKPITIGINHMTHIVIPDYHLWTNKERYLHHGNCINPLSKLLCGCGLPDRLVRIHHKGNYFRVDYLDREDSPLGYQKGIITGFYRTAGCLAIMIAHLLQASQIYIVGMDGFTLHKPVEVDDGVKNQHCYGRGHTDDYSWKNSLVKDNQVCNILRSLKEYGINFKILTPTVFNEFYDGSIYAGL